MATISMPPFFQSLPSHNLCVPYLTPLTMAFRAIAAARPPSTLSCAPNLSPPLSKPVPPPRPQCKKPNSLSSSSTSTAFSLVALFSAPNDAKAFGFSKEQILTTLTDAENAIDQVAEVGSSLFQFSKGIIQAAIGALKPGVDVALPILQKAGNNALEIASPAISGVAKQALETLQNAGFDPMPVVSAAKTIAGAAQQTTKLIENAKPIASTTVDTLLSSDPSTITATAGALFLSYVLLPLLWSVVSFNLQGYKGNLSPAQALDLISSQNYLLIDIRSENDKNKSGIPRLPSSAKNKMIYIPLEELPNKIRGLVRNVKKAEAEIVALKISYLKKVNKRSNLVIMDSYSDTAKIVAKALTSLGFKCWIVADGFSGGRGWLQSCLGTDSYNASLAEVLSPSRVIPASSVRRLGTTRFQPARKFLPGSADD